MKRIALSEPEISGNEWTYVKECLDTGWVSSAGSFVNRFEDQLAAYVRSRHAIACVNGTSALQIALRIVGLQPGEEVLVPILTFIAPINAVRYLGGRPVFFDADEFYNMDIGQVVDFLEHRTEFRGGASYNKTTRRRIRAIVPVHVFGNAADLSPILHIARERNIAIVEDATESLGTSYATGSLKGCFTGTLGDIGCYSFNGNKIITTGGGGMIVTDNPDYAAKARYLATQAKDDPVRYVHNEIGYNFRMTNVQAALGVAQLERLPEYLARKRDNFEWYQEQLKSVPGLRLVQPPPYATNNYWMYALRITPEVYGRDVEAMMEAFASKGIESRPVWYPNHRQQPYSSCEIIGDKVAMELWRTTINIPCSVGLKPEERQRVSEVLRHE